MKNYLEFLKLNEARKNLITISEIEKVFKEVFDESKVSSVKTLFDKDEENIYHLVVTFPKEYDSFEYQDIIEGVTICIESKQIIDENT